MTNNNKLDENIEGVDNFKAWKYRFMLILEEHDLEVTSKKRSRNQKEMKQNPSTRRI